MKINEEDEQALATSRLTSERNKNIRLEECDQLNQPINFSETTRFTTALNSQEDVIVTGLSRESQRGLKFIKSQPSKYQRDRSRRTTNRSHKYHHEPQSGKSNRNLQQIEFIKRIEQTPSDMLIESLKSPDEDSSSVASIQQNSKSKVNIPKLRGFEDALMKSHSQASLTIKENSARDQNDLNSGRSDHSITSSRN